MRPWPYWSATRAEASQKLTPRIVTSRSGTPTAWRISAIDRSAVKCSGV
jgi:hypothetical protein